MNLDLIKQGPRQSWPRNTIDATEKVAPGSFYLVLCFSFNVLCVEEKKPDCAILCYHNFCQNSKQRPKYFKVQILKLCGENALHFPKMNKSFSLLVVEQDPGSSSSPADFKMNLYHSKKLQLLPEAVPWRRIHQVLSTP